MGNTGDLTWARRVEGGCCSEKMEETGNRGWGRGAQAAAEGLEGAWLPRTVRTPGKHSTGSPS